ncbi:hypothetical protein PIB30_049552 [Stylosanthes scabra]|uniref:Uncharacterized protein n=1 Tax=Stylosanthes scabra TaxID=79078 RepID=A0ABU6ZG40_9FABA|nr:hypothetical protein [Stylosanthes scabra]
MPATHVQLKDVEQKCLVGDNRLCRPSPSAKGKAKAYEPPTRSSPRLAALRSQSAANPHPEAPVTTTVPASTARRAALISIKSYSMKLSERDNPSNTEPTPSLPPKKRPIQKGNKRRHLQGHCEAYLQEVSKDRR